jgi:predicted RNA-binding Zn-ribbon protein involved in translation (DUF1610 family)
MLIIFGTQNKIREIKSFDFLPDNCPHCGKVLKVMEVSRWFSMFYFPIIKSETLGYYYFCPSCNLEFSTKDLKPSKYN